MAHQRELPTVEDETREYWEAHVLGDVDRCDRAESGGREPLDLGELQTGVASARRDACAISAYGVTPSTRPTSDSATPATATLRGMVARSSTTPSSSSRCRSRPAILNPWSPMSHPDSSRAPAWDMSITVRREHRREAGMTRQQADEWAYHWHQRAAASGRCAPAAMGLALVS